MPNRIIKDSIHVSEDVNRMTDFEFRLWIHLIAYVDDYGRGDARPAVIRGKCFPLKRDLTEEKISETMKSLSKKGSIILYQVNGTEFFYFPTWSSHQRIQTKKSKYPEPPTVSHGDSQSFTVSHGDSPPESNPIQSNIESNPIRNQSETNLTAVEIPTREEVKAFAMEIGATIDPDYFFEWYSNAGWKTSAGEPIKIWRNVFLSWDRSEKQKEKDGISGSGKPCEKSKGSDGGKRFNVHYDVKCPE